MGYCGVDPTKQGSAICAMNVLLLLVIAKHQ